jgi:hypothetical protein
VYLGAPSTFNDILIIYPKKKKREGKIIFSFLGLNLVLEFLISRIWSLGFAQILNRSLYHFSVKMNGLSYVTYVLIDTPTFISAPNINAISLSAKSSIKKKKKKKKKKKNKRPNSINKNHILRHPNFLDL